MNNLPRLTLFDDIESDSSNVFCRLRDLNNEASVEHFFVSRLISDLGYKDHQIKTKQSIESLTVGEGSRLRKYKPDYVLLHNGTLRCIIDAKGVNEDPFKWVEQCSGYCLALNRRHPDSNPIRYFLLSNGITTVCYEWDKEQPLIVLDFSDFKVGNPKYEQLKDLISLDKISTSESPSNTTAPLSFDFASPNTAKMRQLFATCHNAIWKSEGYGVGPAFLAFVKLMFVKLWADRKLRNESDLKHLFADKQSKVSLPANSVMFSVEWIEKREQEGVHNPINDLFEQLRDEIEVDIGRRKKKRIFDRNEDLGLLPDTIKDVVRRLEHFDMFGIDEDLNGRLFETFLNATMRGRDLGQFFTPRSVVKMMTRLVNLKVNRTHQDKIIDACCGTGGFLIEALSDMRNKVRENNSLSQQEKNTLIESIANNSLYGIDYGKDPPLARVTRINMYLHGDGGSRIYYADALDKDIDHQAQTDAEIISNMEELNQSLRETQFDVVLTNPPFSMTKEAKNPAELRVLKQYELARKSEHSTDIRNSLKSGVMFIERYYDLLKQGGMLITVIDDALLSIKDFGYVRDYIRKKFVIKAIISLPGDAFRASGARVKTTVLVLEKRHSDTDEQPDVFYYFSKHLGVDDKSPKTPDYEVEEARINAEKETDDIVTQYNKFLLTGEGQNVLSSEHITDRLDLRNCVPLFGRMTETWKAKGVSVKRLDEVAKPSEQILNPDEHSEREFSLIKVSYDGYCELESTKMGKYISYSSMFEVREGQLVFSGYNALKGAVGIVPPELDGSLVATSSYIVLDCSLPYNAAYIWSLLRSHEIRADIQSISTGSGRYSAKWSEVGQVVIPWLSEEKRQNIGNALIQLWESEKQIEKQREDCLLHLNTLEIESESSRERFEVSKAPK